jgi:branched-chain amino acid transport system substrate-binding protein
VPRFLPKSILLLLALIMALGLAACEQKGQFNTIFGGRPAASGPPQTLGGQPPGTLAPGQPGTPEIASIPPDGTAPTLQPPGEPVDERFAPALPRATPSVPRVAILLPLSGPSASIGTAMLNAAELALFHFSDRTFELLPQDTRGTPEGAAEAAAFAISDGASLILGPLFSQEVEAVTPAAQAAGVKVIAFTNDRRVARDGVFVMGFRPDEQVDRVVRFAYSRGMRRFALLAPEDTYGRTINEALRRTVDDLAGAQLVQVESYDPNASEFSAVVRRLADYDRRRANLLQQREELAARADDEVAKAALHRLSTLQTLGDVPFDALLIADGGKRLEQLAALLPYYDIDPKKTRIMGTGLWDAPGIGKEPALQGAWYAAPSPTARRTFEQQYAEIYGSPPPRLATLAYDATAIAALFAPTQGSLDVTALTSPQGFAGRDGVFRFLSEGVAERGLSVHQVNPTGATVISEAPQSFTTATN